MSDLTKLQNELANKDAGVEYDGGDPEYAARRNCRLVGFYSGWNALLSHLTEAAGEFDHDAFLNLMAEKLDECISHRDIKVAQLVFEQDRARIGLAKLEADSHCAAYAKLMVTTNKLEAQLEQMNRDCISLSLHEQRMAAAEARLRELEHECHQWRMQAEMGTK